MAILALAWQTYDAADSSTDPVHCTYADCPGEAILVHGDRPYCRAHASMYGALRRGRAVVSLHGRT
jgi:hypothetical protein